MPDNPRAGNIYHLPSLYRPAPSRPTPSIKVQGTRELMIRKLTYSKALLDVGIICQSCRDLVSGSWPKCSLWRDIAREVSNRNSLSAVLVGGFVPFVRCHVVSYWDF